MIADGPLAQYQCTEATKEDTLALVKSLNKALPQPHDMGLLCGNFENKWPDFEAELNRILSMDVGAPADFVETEADVAAGYKLSAEARKLLVEATIADGIVQMIHGGAGTEVVAGGCEMDTEGGRRSQAGWEQAVRDLVRYDLLIPRGSDDEMFEMSAKGYEVADVLQKQGESAFAADDTGTSTSNRTLTMSLCHGKTGHCKEAGLYLTVFEASRVGFEGVIGCPGQENMPWHLEHYNDHFQYDCGKRGRYEIRLIGSSSQSFGDATTEAQFAITRLDESQGKASVDDA